MWTQQQEYSSKKSPYEMVEKRGVNYYKNGIIVLFNTV